MRLLLRIAFGREVGSQSLGARCFDLCCMHLAPCVGIVVRDSEQESVLGMYQLGCSISSHVRIVLELLGMALGDAALLLRLGLQAIPQFF